MAFDFIQRIFQQHPDILDRLAESNTDPSAILTGLSKQAGQAGQGGLAETFAVQSPSALNEQALPPILPTPEVPAVSIPVTPTSQPQLLSQSGKAGAPLDAGTLQALQQLMRGQTQQGIPGAPQPPGGRQFQLPGTAAAMQASPRRPTLSELLGG